jgi:hypothetical protein
MKKHTLNSITPAPQRLEFFKDDITRISMQGKVIEQSSHSTDIEEWRCTNLLLPAKLDKVHIFASKKVCIQNEYVTIRSEASPLVDNTLRTGEH